MGGSGGGSSGAVSYPAYMQAVHGRWLDRAGVATPNQSLVDAINSAYDANPFTGAVAFNPNDNLTAMESSINAFDSLVDSLSHTASFTEAYNTAYALILEEETPPVDSAETDADIAAYAAVLNDQLESRQLPAFRAGMLNIGAVHTSAFIMGEALLRAYMGRDVSRYATEVRGKLATQRYEIQANHKIQRGNLVRVATGQIIATLLKRFDLEDEVTKLHVEYRRMVIVANKERDESQMDIDEKEGLWQVELFGYAGNLLGSAGGGTHQNQKRTNKAASALGGALSGAAVGASVGGPYGAAAGAVVGAVGGYLMA